MGDNVNGPSVIHAPPWLERPLGRYYTYFAHHDGAYIRLAYADEIEGPWQTYEPGVMDLHAAGFAGHIASPDVHVDTDNRQVRMYFHGCDSGTTTNDPQYTRVALSDDGHNFRVFSDNLGPPYFRVFHYANAWYALAMPGRTFRSADGMKDFVEGTSVLSASTRHSAIALAGEQAHVVFTSVGDNPEHLQYATMDLSLEWSHWQTSHATSLLYPEMDYEGADCEPIPSKRGLVTRRERQLRDPALFADGDKLYLFYAIAGECGIGLARLTTDTTTH